MKFEIKATRTPGGSWRGTIDDKELRACPSDVATLFHMGRGNKVTFEISNSRPRGHEDYHVFEYGLFSYMVIELTEGYAPHTPPGTSDKIRSVFTSKGQNADRIYVSIY